MAPIYFDQNSTDATKHLNIVIIGGSLTGLMHGIVAKRHSHNVQILEQYESSTREGQAAGICAMEYGTAFLKKHDLLADKPYAVSCTGVQILDRDAHVKFQIARPLAMTSWNVLYYRLRANFDGLTSEYCPEAPVALPQDGKAIYEHGKTVSNVAYSGNMLTVEYADSHGGAILKPDVVIAADGSTSRIRDLLQPGLRRTYAGYAIWRGTVLENDVTEASRSLFQTKTNLMTVEGGYLALYTIPGENGTLDPGQRLLNYVWYCNYAEDSPDLAAAMTDATGKKHRNTLPIGKMSPTVWNKQKDIASKTLPSAFAELIHKTTQPFITIVSDIASTQASFFDGRLLLVGDALVPFRPHVACSTNQAALNALLLEKMLNGDINLAQWERQVLNYAHATRLRSITWGNWYQVGYLAWALSQAKYLLVVVTQKVQGFWYA